jgi:exodeoxyribonuclease VIII
MTRITPPEPGIYHDVENDIYRAWEAASCSTLQTILHRSPKHARHAELTPREPTPALIEGTAIHTALLEPHRFADAYTMAQQCTATKKSGERCGNAAVSLVDGYWTCGVHAKGKPTSDAGPHLVPQADYERWQAICEAVHEHPTAGKIVRAIEHAEPSLSWRDRPTGCPCKCRIDGIAPRFGTLIDVKTTEDAGADFARSVHRYAYYRQAAWYLAGAAAVGLDAESFAFIAVEKKPPHDVCVYQCPDDLLALGHEELQRAVETYQECLAVDHWPGHADKPVWLQLPEWRQRQLERDKFTV